MRFQSVSKMLKEITLLLMIVTGFSFCNSSVSCLVFMNREKRKGIL